MLRLRLNGATPTEADAAISESFRATLASLMFSPDGRGLTKVAVVTSASPGDGKTTITMNLGTAVAETGRRVVLVDGDIRRPMLHTIFGVPNTTGLVDLLAGNESLHTTPMADMVHMTGTPGLHVLPRGSGPDRPGLLYSERLPELLTRLRREFDLVLVDAPPTLHVADTRVMGKYSDGVIFVVRSGRTTHEFARMAIQRLVDAGVPMLGTILNGCEPKKLQRYGYGYGYGYGSQTS
jgi:receptor protein-tyrosine kinase